MAERSAVSDMRAMFSQPLGSGALYGRPPYHYRNAEDMVIVYRADPNAIRHLLPPGMELSKDEAICSLSMSNYPFSVFGPYRETSLKVKVAFEGREFMFSVAIYADNASATAVGREMWGFGKKDAHFTLICESDQRIMTVARPAGHELFSGGMTVTGLAEPQALADIARPTLSLRIMPGIGPEDQPALCQLISLNATKHYCLSAGGEKEFYEGNPSLTMKAASRADPLYLFAPVTFIGAWYSKSDFALDYGTLVHDYLTSASFSGSTWGESI